MAGAESGKTPVMIPEWALADREWAAALCLLTSPTLVRAGAMQHVHFARAEIDVPRLLEVSESWSSGERAMVRAACDLFNGLGEATLTQVLWSLDDGNLRLVLEAIAIRRRLHGWPLGEEDGS